MNVSASNERKSSILESLTSLYINTARPVSSSLIKDEFDLSVSSATIRNILVELEELGYMSSLILLAVEFRPIKVTDSILIL